MEQRHTYWFRTNVACTHFTWCISYVSCCLLSLVDNFNPFTLVHCLWFRCIPIHRDHPASKDCITYTVACVTNIAKELITRQYMSSCHKCPYKVFSNQEMSLLYRNVKGNLESVDDFVFIALPMSWGCLENIMGRDMLVYITRADMFLFSIITRMLEFALICSLEQNRVRLLCIHFQNKNS